MARLVSHPWVLKAGHIDYGLCHYFNQWGRQPSIRELFCTLSRLGDGAIWYFILIALPFLGGLYGLWVSLICMTSGFICMRFYKAIKAHFVRERPFVTWKTITPYIVPLDRYSFPSGHTMNAVHFSWVLGYFFPSLALPLLILVGGVGMSRMVLGMHYPSDVIIGAGLGSAVAFSTLGLMQLFA